MADFAPPSGPPPPKVPAGWKAVYNDQYKEWFYVNTFTKKSQWDKPTEPVYGDDAPAGPPPGYDPASSRATGPEKGGANNTNDDEALARKLQAEEQARAGGLTSRGASDSYYQGSSAQNPPYGQSSSTYGQPGSTYGQSSSPYGQTQSPSSPQQGSDGKRGFFSKLSGKLGGGSSAARPPQQAYGGYPSQGYPQQQYGQQYPPQGYYPPQGGYQQQQGRTGGGGMGAGGMLLGAGAGLVGGALLMDAIEDHDQSEYNQGYDQGQMADDGGGDYGGGDFGGGDDGGGDF